ncbi:aromatic acid exporter family protein [Chungangia koreensis]|uniref:Aromatic acid exporter family protein n=1 Tax=Chungangia koreensis TaxID=752657 RepID=A0ABV8X5G2_9LACT
MKLGARIIKTGLAIVAALFVANLLNMPTPVFAGIAAIFAIQPSIYRSYLTIVEQIQGNFIGAAIAVLFGLMFGHDYLIVGFAAVITIGIMTKLKLEKVISLALVTLIAIMEIQGDDFLTFALIRFLTILIGVLAAFLVNLMFIPPKYETKLFRKIHHTQDEIIRWIRLTGRLASEHSATKESIENLKEELTKIDNLYSLYKEERSYFKSITRSKIRKLVVYRQMIATTRSSLDVLQRLHRYENEMTQLPEHLLMMIQERFDFVLTYHEQLHLKYVGKLKPELSFDIEDIEAIHRQEVMEIFVNEIAKAKEEEDFSSYHLLHVLSSLLYYEEQLEHLDRLIVSRQKFHKEKTKIELEEDYS